MTKLRPDELLAAACIESALPGIVATQRDCNSGHRIYDLDLIRDASIFGAVEVTAAADRDSVELWNVVHERDGRWIVPSLAGGWKISLYPSARVKKLRDGLPILLAELEGQGITEIGSDYCHRGDPYRSQAERLGIALAYQAGTDFPGSIYFTIKLPIDRVAGFVADTGDALAEWVSEWIIQPEHADNLQKLRESGKAERHLFVVLPEFTTAPFKAFDVLTRNNAPLPTVAPTLPPEVTHLWMLSWWAIGDGFRWSPDGGWARFSKRFDLTGSAHGVEPVSA